MLETRRLVLRPLAPGDAVGLHRVCNEPAVRRHLFGGEPVSVETAEALIRRGERDFAGGGVVAKGVRASDGVTQGVGRIVTYAGRDLRERSEYEHRKQG